MHIGSFHVRTTNVSKGFLAKNILAVDLWLVDTEWPMCCCFFVVVFLPNAFLYCFASWVKKNKKKTLDSVILLLNLTNLYITCGVACYWKSCTTVTLLKIILKLVAWLILISFSPVLDHSRFFWLGRAVQETWRPAGSGETGSLIYLPPHLSLPVSVCLRCLLEPLYYITDLVWRNFTPHLQPLQNLDPQSSVSCWTLHGVHDFWGCFYQVFVFILLTCRRAWV